jgi:hypothetical protein
MMNGMIWNQEKSVGAIKKEFEPKYEVKERIGNIEQLKTPPVWRLRRFARSS